MNELYFLIEVVLVFGGLLVNKKIFGKYGLIAWVAISAILANIQVNESVTLFGISATLGNVLFASSFVATDLLSECYSKDDAKIAVKLGVFAMIAYIIFTQVTLLFTPADGDIANTAFQSIFTMSARTTLASLIMYAIANWMDVVLFDKLSKKWKGKHLGFRSVFCAGFCNCVENFCFVFLAFFGVMEIPVLIEIALSTCAIEIILALFNLPIVYLAKGRKAKKCLK